MEELQQLPAPEGRVSVVLKERGDGERRVNEATNSATPRQCGEEKGRGHLQWPSEQPAHRGRPLWELRAPLTGGHSEEEKWKDLATLTRSKLLGITKFCSTRSMSLTNGGRGERGSTFIPGDEVTCLYPFICRS